MSWTVYGTDPSLVLSETTTATSKTLKSTDLPNFVSEIRILGVRIELTTDANAGTREPRIQIQTDDANQDVLFEYALSDFTSTASTKVYELNCGAPFSAEVNIHTGAMFGHNVPELRIAPGIRLRVYSSAGGQAGDSYTVHVRAESV